MAGMMETFAVPGGTASGYLATPPDGAGPGLIVLQEWWGLVDHIKDVTDRFAAAGYVAFAPDLYRGEKTTHPDEAQRLLMALEIEGTAAMLRGAAEFLRAHPAVTPVKVGVLGFCMGGQLALFAATRHPDVIDAVVDFYGIFNPAVPVDLSRLRAPVLAHFGVHDPWIPREKADALMAEVAAAGVAHEVHFYDAGHAFFNDARPEAYDAAAAESAWTRTLAFLERTIG
jgi:carboxymethylenebutenolidase